MIESLHIYKDLCRCGYVDKSGLYEILESIFTRLSTEDIWFNAYCNYGYYNAIKTHTLRISKVLDTSGSSKLFSQLLLDYCGYELHITRIEPGNLIKEFKYTINVTGEMYILLYTFIKTWFAEILISVKEYNTKQKEKNNE